MLNYRRRLRDLTPAQKDLVREALYAAHGNPSAHATMREDAWTIERKLGTGEPLVSHEATSLREILEQAYGHVRLHPGTAPALKVEALGWLAAYTYDE